MRFSKILSVSCGGLFATVSAMSWKQADVKAKKFVADMTIDEKIGLITGVNNQLGKCIGEIPPIERKNFNGICLQDGPAGPRWSHNNTSWQSGINTAATFNRKLIRQFSKAEGKEFKAKGINIALGPSMNIMRAPAAGRNFEIFGEDPYLAGQCAFEEVTGIQEAGCMVAAKHFILNDQEHNREASSSEYYDEQAFFEIYVEPFYKSIEAGAGSLMVAYNAVNNTYMVQNYHLLTEVVKEQLGFQGFLMSDWWAIHDTEFSFNAGVDMNMAGGIAWGPDHMNDSYWGPALKQAIEDGKVEMSRLDDAVTRVMRSLYKLEQVDKFPEVNLLADATAGHAKINLKAAQESHVLLKNEDEILPLRHVRNKKIAVIGKDSIPTTFCDDQGCANGTLAQGWGSGTTNFDYISDPLSAIQARAKKAKAKIVSFPEDDPVGAAKVAAKADIAIVFVQAHSGEGYITVEGNSGDRNDLDLWHNGNELVAAVAEANENVIVVIHGPGVVNLPFIDDVKGIIFAGYPGQESGNAAASVIFGDVNPSGHLPFTWGKKREDYCCDVQYPDPLPGGGEEKTLYQYKEGKYVGYRWFDKHDIEPLFPFGFGLSYTEFEFSDLKLKTKTNSKNLLTRLTATFYVENIGDYAGAAVPMLFLSFPDTEEMGDYPMLNLKGFEKIELKAGQRKKVTINVEQHELSYYNVATKKYTVPTGGKFTVYIGSNARSLDLKKSIRNPNKKSPNKC